LQVVKGCATASGKVLALWNWKLFQVIKEGHVYNLPLGKWYVNTRG
jgi:hypothetical protein